MLAAVSERVPDREPISEVPEPPPFTLSPETSPASVDLAQSHSETVIDTVKPSMLSQGVIATTSIPILSSTIPTKVCANFRPGCRNETRCCCLFYSSAILNVV